MIKRPTKTLRSCLLALLLALIASGAAQDTVELTYLTHENPPSAALHEELIAEFEAAHPDIDITLDPVPFTQFEQKLITGIATGQGADLWWMGDWVVPQYLESGQLAAFDADAFGLSQEEFAAQYDESALTPFVQDGTLYTAGISEYNTFSILYNKDHFEEVGYSAPSEPLTWEAFKDLSEQLRQVDESGNPMRTALAWEFSSPIWANLVLEPMIYQLGGSLINEETGEAQFDSPALVKVMNYWQEMRESNAFDPALTPSYLDDFANGTASMMIGGPWAVASVKGINPDLNIGVMPLPHFADGQRATILYAWAWFVNPNISPEEQAAAWQFLSFLTSHPKAWWDAARYIQPREVDREGASAEAYRLESEPLLETFTDDFQHGVYQARSPQYGQFSNLLLEAFTRVTEGEPVERVLEDAQSSADSIN